MNKVFTIILIMLFNLTISAQWDVVDQIPSQIIYSLHINGNNIYAGGDTLYISNDNGITWKSSLYHSNSPVSALIQIGNTLYAGFYEAGVFRSNDNGISWEEYNTGLTNWGKFPVSFLHWGDTLFSGTDGGGVFFTDLTSSDGWKEYNSGLSWNTSYNILSMCRTNSSVIIGAGINGLYYIRPKGSMEWIEKTINYSGPFSVSPKTLLSFGDTVFAGTRAGIFRSINGGYNWDSVGISAIPLDVTSLVNDGKRIYAGLRRTSDFFVWYSDDMGNTWNSLDHQFNYLSQLHAFNNRLWAATTDGLWYKDLEITSVEEDLKLNSFKLKQNFPNPFNPATTISYTLSQQSNVSITIYDILGREVAVLLNAEQESGDHNINFNADDLSSGLYFCTLKSGNHISTIKMILIK